MPSHNLFAQSNLRTRSIDAVFSMVTVSDFILTDVPLLSAPSADDSTLLSLASRDTSRDSMEKNAAAAGRRFGPQLCRCRPGLCLDHPRCRHSVRFLSGYQAS